jgi:fimbrial chaperone protein
MTRLSTLVAGVAAFTAALACASASTVSVSPVRLTLARSGSAVDLTISNGDPQPTRFSVRAYKWTQSPAGQMELTPSDDVIVYPQSFSIASLDRRVVRIGFVRPLLPVEQSYRVIVSELPPFDEANPNPGIAVLSKFSVPLFITPPGGQAQPAIANVSLQNLKLNFTLAATGNVHLLPTSLQVRGIDAAGKVSFEAAPPVWYVLPGQPRMYDLAVPAGACARTQQVRFDATFDGAPPLHLTLAPARAC